jgi:hypothetical protein
LAGKAADAVRRAYRLDPRGGVRSVVAMLGSEQNRDELLEMAFLFGDDVAELTGLAVGEEVLRELLRQSLQRGVAHAVRPRAIQRLGSVHHGGYPLLRTHLVTFNLEPNRVVAELREVSDVLGIRGEGADEDSALRHLARQFERLVEQKVRIPAHAQRPEDKLVVAVINHLVDWDRFRRENPLTRPLWGKVLEHLPRNRVRVQWLLGPAGVRDETTVLSDPYLREAYPQLRQIPTGKWFRAAVKEYPDRVEWVELPYPGPDPHDPDARRQDWAAIPTILADRPDVWPLVND